MVRKIYLDGVKDLKKYCKAKNAEGEERHYIFKQYYGNRRGSILSYIRITDDEERIGASLVSIISNCYPGKRPFFTHEARAYFFYDKETKKLRTKKHKHVIDALLTEPKGLVGTDFMRPFIPMSQEVLDHYLTGINNPSSIKLVSDRRGDEYTDKKPVYSHKFKYHLPAHTNQIAYAVHPSVMMRFVFLVFSSKVVIKGVLSGKIKTFGEALKARFRHYSCGKFNNKELTLIFMAFGEKGLTFLPHISTDTTGLLKYAEVKLAEVAQAYINSGIPNTPSIRFERGDSEYPKKYYPHMRDLIDMSGTLGRKINFGWSPSRMKEEHDNATKSITAMKLKTAPFARIEYKVPAPEWDGFTIMQTTHDFVRESVEMHHCVGTSDWYFKKCARLQNILISAEHKEERATMEVMVETKNKDNPTEIVFKAIQIQGPGNSKVSKDMDKFLEKNLKRLQASEFATNFIKEPGESLGGGMRIGDLENVEFDMLVGPNELPF